MFCKKGFFKNFTKFTGKYLYQILFLNKVAVEACYEACFMIEPTVLMTGMISATHLGLINGVVKSKLNFILNWQNQKPHRKDLVLNKKKKMKSGFFYLTCGHYRDAGVEGNAKYIWRPLFEARLETSRISTMELFCENNSCSKVTLAKMQVSVYFSAYRSYLNWWRIIELVTNMNDLYLPLSALVSQKR